MAEIRILQTGRAVAAVAFVLFHARASATTFSADTPAWIARILRSGFLGVDFFFILSGFIIYWISRNQEPNIIWFRRFIQNRLIRIFLPYLPIGVGVAIAYTLIPGLSDSHRTWDWLTTFTLAPLNNNPALLVAWTLQHELVFYAIFAVAFAMRRPLLGVLARIIHGTPENGLADVA